MLTIRPFEIEDRDEALLARTELDADDFDFLLGYSFRRGFDEYLDQLAAHEQGLGIPDGWVPSALWGAFVDGELVGRTCIRFELNDHLMQVGGHIGYGVRPAYRRRGYATEILRLSLEQLALRGIEKALVTCDETEHRVGAHHRGERGSAGERHPSGRRAHHEVLGSHQLNRKADAGRRTRMGNRGVSGHDFGNSGGFAFRMTLWNEFRVPPLACSRSDLMKPWKGWR